MSEKQTPITPSNFLYSVLPSVLLETNLNRAQGVDLSHHSGWYDPTKATKKADFAITKATEGYNWIDPALKEIWNGMLNIEIRGLYHYQRSGMSWSAQVTHFLRTVEPFDYHLVALDVESINNTVNATFIQDTYRILNYLEQNSEAKVVLYTNPNLFQNYIYPIWVQYFGEEGRQKAMTIPLWIAQYWNTRSPDKNPGMPTQRQSWNIYQWTDRGIGSDWGTQELGVDLNVFNGSVESMRSWLGLSEPAPNPDPIPEPVPDPILVEPETENELWKATIITNSRLYARSYPQVLSETKTGDYGYTGQTFKGKLWSGNGYVWIKVLDLESALFGHWLAVRSLEGSQKFIKLEKVAFAEPRPASTYWLVKQDKELGDIWRPNLPQVHPLFIEPKETKGTHFSPMEAWMQRLAIKMNPDMPLSVLSHGYWTHEWITNDHGFNHPDQPKANYILNQDLTKEFPKAESLTSGGSLLKAVSIGDGWLKVETLDYHTPVSYEFLKEHPEFWTRGTYVGRNGNVYRILGDKYIGKAMIHPMITDTKNFGAFIQIYKVKEWTRPENPDPLTIYP